MKKHISPPLSASDAGSLTVQLMGFVDVDSSCVKVTNEIREACSCWQAHMGVGKKRCNRCRANPRDGVSWRDPLITHHASIFRLSQKNDPAHTAGILMSFGLADFLVSSLEESPYLFTPGEFPPEAEEDELAIRLSSAPEEVSHEDIIGDRAVFSLGAVSLTHDGVYFSDGVAGWDTGNSIFQATRWRHRFIDVFLLADRSSPDETLSNTGTELGQEARTTVDSLASNPVGDIIALDSRLTPLLIGSIADLNPDALLSDGVDQDGGHPGQKADSWADTTAMINHLLALRRLVADDKSSDGSEPTVDPQIRDEAMSWLFQAKALKHRVAKKLLRPGTLGLSRIQRADLLARRGHLTAARKLVGRRKYDIDRIRTPRPPGPLISPHFCDACGGRAKLGTRFCIECLSDVTEPLGPPHDFLPRSKPKRWIR